MKQADPSKVYPEIAFGGFSRVDCTVPFLCRAQELSRGAKRILEVGCGRGLAAEDDCALRKELRNFRGLGKEVIGIDVDPAASSNPFIDEFRLIGKDYKWPVESESVDMAFCDYVLEHVVDPSGFFFELGRVLVPGGTFIARTPSRWSYIALLASIIPNRLHAAVLRRAQQSRRTEDVFPTVYRANTVRGVRNLLKAQGLSSVVYSVEGEPNYMAFSQAAYSLMSVLSPLLPGSLKSTMVVVARKAL
jgi:SAM-dependent methyltransferase